MKLKDALETYLKLATRVNDLTRQLCFAGLGIIWLFKIDGAGGQKLPKFLLIPSAAIAVALLCDFLQFVYGTLAWERLHDLKEHQRDVDEDTVFFTPRSIIVPTKIMFLAKIAFVSAAYVMLLGYLTWQLS
jgi:hypothetical protein